MNRFNFGWNARQDSLILALSSILVASIVFSGCQGNGSDDATGRNAGNGESTAESSEPGKGMDAPIPAGGLVTKPLTGEKVAATGRFTALTASETGLEFGNELEPANMRKYLLNGAGLATGDYDNDGLVDVYAVSQDGENKLFRQTAPWQFEDVTDSACPGEIGLSGGAYWGTGASFADLDNDGLLDLYVCNINGPNLLFINRGDGTFTEEADRRGAGLDRATTMASIADYDNDGDLDIYLVNNRLFSILEESPDIRIRQVNGVDTVHPDFVEQYFLLDGRVQEAGQRDTLLQNDGTGVFTDVADAAGIGGYDMGLSATWWDFDNDGHLDLYVGNDLKSPDHLYHNQGDGTFVDVVAEMTGHTPWFSMGADAGDLNGDGLPELLVADMSSTTHYKQKTTMGEMGNSAWFLTMGKPRQFMRNTLFVNTGTDRFMEAANLTGLDSTDWTWSIKFGDFDSDGLLDVFATNGVGRNMNDSDLARQYKALLEAGKTEEAEQQLLQMPPLNEENLAFRNRGDLQFSNVAADWGLNHEGVSQGATMADIDRDGDLDLLVNNMNEPLGVYRNDIGGNNNLLVQLKGTRNNRFGIGATVTVRCGETLQTRMMKLASGYMSADEPLLHFGLGEATRADEITVRWPDGHHQRFNSVAAGQWITITEGTEGAMEPPQPTVTQSWLTELPSDESGLAFVHRELEIDDYRYQPLLPNKLTQLGPGVALGDVDGDGQDDLYVGNGAGLPPQFFLQKSPGRFEAAPPWYSEERFEDMGALLFDADSDGDNDLYVASGGYEQEAGSAILRDRLYVNDGQGNFSLHTEALPDIRESSSCVSACDFDRDGDLDLFVGTRLLPRRWPLPASSYLLENNNGTFTDISAERATPLADVGLVTGCVWTDFDGDGWTDLVLSLEWGSLRCLRNDQGQLVDVTQPSGMAPYRGWWNTVLAGDVDHDGDMDLVGFNVGLNTKYHCTPEHPVQVYVGDFDNSGSLDIVETEWEGDTCFPVRGKSCSSNAMPFLKEKFTTYHEFALADVTEIYTEETLDEAATFAVSHLESMVFINDGQGQFMAHSLPRLAQIAPGFGGAIADLNGDGHADLFMGQNFMNPQPETGQFDGGVSMVLAGDGTGHFAPLEPGAAGVVVPGQAAALCLTDLNGDQAPDVVMSVNNEPLRAWRNQTAEPSRHLAITVAGLPGNPTGIGTHLRVQTQSGKSTAYEIRAGEGYLSQSSPVVFATSPGDDPIVSIDIRWPDGHSQSVAVAPQSGPIVLEMQSRVHNTPPGLESRPSGQ